jgi:leucyl-tRNA synthetase
MEKDILTPMNHREIEYKAKSLSGIKCPDSFDVLELEKVLEWLEKTGKEVFDDDLVMDYGMDCLRLYLMFESTPRENDAPFYDSWNEGALEGMYKFLARYRRIVLAIKECDIKAQPESLQTLKAEIDVTYAKINKYLKRGNEMPNRHNIISALMELLNTFQKVLRIGEIIATVHNHEIEMAVPHSKDYEEGNPLENDGNDNKCIFGLCNELINIMSPFAPDMSKYLKSLIQS